MSGLLLAVDGGNAKTDLALFDRDGNVLALVHGPGSSPHEHGLEAALDRIEALVIEAGADGPVDYAELLLAGVDFPAEVRTLQARATERGWPYRRRGPAVALLEAERLNGDAPEGVRRPANLEDAFVALTGQEIE